MKYLAHIQIMPLKDLLDPQGKAVNGSLHNLGLTAIDQVRIGKHITLEVEAQDESAASELVHQACKRLLVNQVMESYTFQLDPIH